MKFDVILADPPWHFKTYGKSKTKVYTPQEHYKTMTIEEIKNLPIGQFTNNNAVLFFWVVDWLSPSLCEEIINHWGFTYKTRAWVWIKSNPLGFGFWKGRGYYTQSNPEDCWLCVKGSMSVACRSVLSIIYAPVRKHSQKPDEQYHKIEKLYPNRQYLELFARRKHPGWSVWGNEVKSDIELELIS